MTIAQTLHPELQKKKWSYLGSLALNKIPKGTYFLQLLKCERAKSPYFCALWPRSRDMTLSSFKDRGVMFVLSSKEDLPISRDMTISSFGARVVRFKLSSEEKIAKISAPGPQIKKVRTLCNLKL